MAAPLNFYFVEGSVEWKQSIREQVEEVGPTINFIIAKLPLVS